MEKKWIYVNEDNNKVRYVLGYSGINPLICIGINPSTATQDKLDNTLRSVERIALNNGYDSFIMFNVYPIRSTVFENLSKNENEYYRKRNKEEINKCIQEMQKPLNVWLAFGNLVDKRIYMKDCMADILDVLKEQEVRFWDAGRTKADNPKHPLYLSKDTKLEEMEIAEYWKLKKW